MKKLIMLIAAIFIYGVNFLHSQVLPVFKDPIPGIGLSEVTKILVQELVEQSSFSESSSLMTQITGKGEYSTIIITPDDKYVLCEINNNIEVFELKTGLRVKYLNFPSKITTFKLSDDSSILAVGTKYHGINIVNFPTGDEIIYLEPEKFDEIYPRAFDRRNEILFGVGGIQGYESYTHHLLAWDIETGEQIFDYRLPDESKYVYNQDSNIVAILDKSSNSGNSRLLQFDIKSGKDLSPIQLDFSLNSERLYYQPFSDNLVVVNPYGIRIVNTTTGKSNYVRSWDRRNLGWSFGFFDEGQSVGFVRRSKINFLTDDLYRATIRYDLSEFKNSYSEVGEEYRGVAVSSNLEFAVVGHEKGLMFCDLKNKEVYKKIDKIGFLDYSRVMKIVVNSTGEFVALIREMGSNYDQFEYWNLTTGELKTAYKYRSVHTNDYSVFFHDKIPYLLEVDINKQHRYYKEEIYGGWSQTGRFGLYRITDSMDHVSTLFFPLYGNYSWNIDSKNERILISVPAHLKIGEKPAEYLQSGGNQSLLQLTHSLYGFNFKDFSTSIISQWNTTDRGLNDFVYIHLSDLYIFGDDEYLFMESLHQTHFSQIEQHTRILTSDNNFTFVNEKLLGELKACVISSKQIISKSLIESKTVVYSLSENSPVLLLDNADSIIITPDETKAILILPDKLSDGENTGHIRIYNTKTWEVIRSIRLDIPTLSSITENWGGIHIDSSDVSNDSIVLGSSDGSFRVVNLDTGKIDLTVYSLDDGHYIGWDSENNAFGTKNVSDYAGVPEPMILGKPVVNPFYGREMSVNDGILRVRALPTLDSEVVGRLDTGVKGITIRRSESKMQIGEMNDYWYLVNTDDGVRGWCYGYFLDVEPSSLRP